MLIRIANANDVDFLTEAVIQADRSGTDISSYTGLFHPDEMIVKSAIRTIILEDLGGFELSLSCFRVVEAGGQAVAALSAWIEAERGVSSAMKKISSLAVVLPKGVMEKAREKLKIAAEISLERAASTLQIESVYTLPGFRGFRYPTQLIISVIKEFKSLKPELSKVQVQLMGENRAALKAYLHAGFEVKETRTSDNEYICELLPGRTKLLMEKYI